MWGNRYSVTFITSFKNEIKALKRNFLYTSTDVVIVSK
jgi:hypothetical protein